MDQGWAFPPGLRPKSHYFTGEKLSLCGAWSSDGLTMFDLDHALEKSPDDCKRCRRQLEARGVRRGW
jgi:hypothetical protein